MSTIGHEKNCTTALTKYLETEENILYSDSKTIEYWERHGKVRKSTFSYFSLTNYWWVFNNEFSEILSNLKNS